MAAICENEGTASISIGMNEQPLRVLPSEPSLVTNSWHLTLTSSVNGKTVLSVLQGLSQRPIL